MSPATWLVVFGAIGALLAFSLYKQFGTDRFDALANRLRARSRIVSRGALFEGARQKDVVLALTDSTFIYETADGQSSFDRQWIREVGYENELSSGKSVGEDDKVLKLRCFSRTFEFVLSRDVFHEWEAILPAYCEMAART